MWLAEMSIAKPWRTAGNTSERCFTGGAAFPCDNERCCRAPPHLRDRMLRRCSEAKEAMESPAW